MQDNNSFSSWLTYLLGPTLSQYVLLNHFVHQVYSSKGRKATSEPLSEKLSAWDQVSKTDAKELDANASYWWRSSGYVLSTFLDKAGYRYPSQIDLLCLFRDLAPHLGAARGNGKNAWQSFMTDDYNPIELSWDWQTGGKAPKIRFSIEAVGSEAGTPRDPDNANAAFEFRRALPQLVPGTNMAWLKHFQEQLVDGTQSNEGGEGHATKEFYAFDLGRDGTVVSKAYFFPGYKARSTGQSSLDVVSEAIHSAPDSSAEKVQALDQIREFLDDAKLTSVEIEMLAIDLIDPAESRFKIYFRVRDTSFASFRHVITLGGRLPDTQEQRQGLAEMKKLYKKLFVPQHTESSWDEQTQLPLTDHRTAGLLYFAEFRYGSAFPKFKAYLPVRHYAASEEATIAALQDHLQDNTYMDAYITAVRAVFREASLKASSGLQTYLGCSIEEGGQLRLVSYVNPRETEFTWKV